MSHFIRKIDHEGEGARKCFLRVGKFVTVWGIGRHKSAADIKIITDILMLKLGHVRLLFARKLLILLSYGSNSVHFDF